MKKTLSIMIMAAALLLMTQCRKDEMPAVMPETNTVSMTVTAGPGSKTDITPAGAIKWSDNDKIYVGHNGTYVGYLTLVSGAGSATGTFSGDVTLPDGTTGEQTFHFFYLGSDNSVAPAVGATSVDVLFNEQNIYNDGGKLVNANKYHVGYGTASGTVKDGVVTGINVTLVSKVALARFSFKKGGADYTDALTLSGTNIFNKMTVNFNANDFDFTPVKDGNITLTGGYGERYVMLVPTGDATEQTLTFTGSSDEGEGKVPGLESNKFYGMKDAIAVTLEAAAPAAVFTVDKDGTTVEFAPGNLWYGIADGESTPAFHFEANQWDYSIGKWSEEDGCNKWDESHVSHFKWSDAANAVTGDYSYSGDLFFTEASGFEVNGETANTWRTLSRAEWNYLLGFDPEQCTQTETYGRPGAKDLCAWKELGSGIEGLVILPDGTDASVMESITETSDLATHGAVFLPAAGNRDGTVVDVAGSYCYYWSGTPDEYFKNSAYLMNFDSGGVHVNGDYRSNGYSVRLVR